MIDPTWKVFRSRSGKNWIGVNDELKLTIQSNTVEELEEDIHFCFEAMLRDLKKDYPKTSEMWDLAREVVRQRGERKFNDDEIESWAKRIAGDVSKLSD